MDPLHLTEFASERYFSKLRQLDHNEHGSSSTQSAAIESALEPQALQGPTFTIPLGNPRHPHSEDELLHLKPSEQKKRSLGHDLTSLRTQRRPSFAGSFGRLSSKVSIIQTAPSIIEHREEILAQDSESFQGYVMLSAQCSSHVYILTST
jgi:hypothetical protein